jgi:hypothetical protein
VTPRAPVPVEVTEPNQETAAFVAALEAVVFIAMTRVILGSKVFIDGRWQRNEE